jgi:hypothetical protein
MLPINLKQWLAIPLGRALCLLAIVHFVSKAQWRHATKEIWQAFKSVH